MSARRSRAVALHIAPVSAEQALADDITAEWQPVLDTTPDMVRAIIATGHRLLDAKGNKQAIPHGAWLTMFRHGAHCKEGCTHVERPVPFTVRTAQRLIRIAGNEVLSNATHVSHLPADWGLLAALTRLPAPVLTQALADGTITPAMRREEVKALRPAPPHSTDAEQGWMERFARMRAQLIEKAKKESPQARVIFVQELRDIAALIEEELQRSGRTSCP